MHVLVVLKRGSSARDTCVLPSAYVAIRKVHLAVQEVAGAVQEVHVVVPEAYLAGIREPNCSREPTCSREEAQLDRRPHRSEAMPLASVCL